MFVHAPFSETLSLFNMQLTMLAWLVLLTWAQTSYGSALYAFFTDLTIQVGAQDPTTGKLLYSACNSQNIPVFPLEKPNILDTKETPRNGTALTAVGWGDWRFITVRLLSLQTARCVQLTAYPGASLLAD